MSIEQAKVSRYGCCGLDAVLEGRRAAEKGLPCAKDATLVQEMDRKRHWGQTTLLEPRYDGRDRRSIQVRKEVWVELRAGRIL